jgi:hypothetical protein
MSNPETHLDDATVEELIWALLLEHRLQLMEHAKTCVRCNGVAPQTAEIQSKPSTKSAKSSLIELNN